MILTGGMFQGGNCNHLRGAHVLAEGQIMAKYTRM